MLKVLIFIFIAFVIIMGGALILLKTAKKPEIPDNIKTPEQLDREDDDYNN